MHPRGSPSFSPRLSRSRVVAERRALLDYCKLDTLAMVRLLEKLEDLARS